MEELVTTRELLNNVEKYSWEDSLFLPKDEVWSLDSKCAVLNMDDLDDVEEIPNFALENGLQYVLTIQDVQDVVKNVREKNPNCSENVLFDALLYYHKNDAFIVL
jgi:hypothetical protein